MGIVKPLAGYILVETISKEQTDSGLYMPSWVKDKPDMGKVIRVGADLPHFESASVDGGSLAHSPNEPSQVKVGDIIIFHRWGAHDIPGHKNQVLVKFSDIQGIIEEEKEKN